MRHEVGPVKNDLARPRNWHLFAKQASAVGDVAHDMRPGAPHPALVHQPAAAAAAAGASHHAGALRPSVASGRALQLVQLLVRAQLLLEAVALQALQRADVSPAGGNPAWSLPGNMPDKHMGNSPAMCACKRAVLMSVLHSRAMAACLRASAFLASRQGAQSAMVTRKLGGLSSPAGVVVSGVCMAPLRSVSRSRLRLWVACSAAAAMPASRARLAFRLTW